MDGTVTTVIILIFVFSILGGVTGKKGSAPRSIKTPAPSAPSYTAPVDTGRLYTTVDVSPLPSPTFSAGFTAGVAESMKKFIGSYAKKVEPWEAQQISNSILKYSQQYDVNPKIAFGLIGRESRFNRFAVSSSGAQGLGQLLPSTAAGLGVTDPFDIDQNVKGTVRYIRSLMDRFNQPHKVTFALAGYLEGPNRIKRANGFKSHTKGYIEDILNLSKRI